MLPVACVRLLALLDKMSKVSCCCVRLQLLEHLVKLLALGLSFIFLHFEAILCLKGVIVIFHLRKHILRDCSLALRVDLIKLLH